jgi:hypothetical protein
VRFAISIPQQVADGTFDPAAMRAYLTRAEQLGFEGYDLIRARALGVVGDCVVPVPGI